MNPPSYYQHHVFFCCNQRAPGERVCCNDKGATRVRDYAKKQIKKLGLAAPGQTRINMAGCLERCEEGPCVVIYPQGTWYTYVDEEDIDEIIERHIQRGEIVERLKLKDLP